MDRPQQNPSALPEPGPALLLTRLYAPTLRREHVARPRLDAILARGRRGPLTLVVAPAGSGKTSVVVGWLAGEAAQRSTPASTQVAWLSLDADANDPARFWSYLAAACDRLLPGCSAGVQALLQGNQPPPPAALVAAVSNHLAALPWDGDADRPYVLVLDDYHVVERPEIHAGLGRLIAHLPPQLHLVITTRADPPLPLARLRARGQLTELRSADLSFSREELAGMLAAAGEPPLSEAALATLTMRTEGWAAGLQLALLALRGHPDPERFVAVFAGTHRYLVDYLADEVLDQQPAHLRRFLLETSVLERLCGPLCDAVLGIEPGELRSEQAAPAAQPDSRSLQYAQFERSSYSQLLLDEAEGRGLFLVALDSGSHDEAQPLRRWYRYHHLFAEVLRVRLQALAPETVPTLHRRASRWYAAASAAEPALLADAVRHALAAGESDTAAELVDHSTARIWGQGDLRVTLELLHTLPAETIRARPRLALALARATLSAGDLDQVGPLLAHVSTALDTGAVLEDEARLRGWVAALSAHEARLRERPADALALAAEALALLPADELAGRGFVTLGLAMSHHVAGAIATAAEQYGAAIPLLRAAGDRYHELYALALLGAVTLMRGDLAAATAVLEEALRRARVGSAMLPVAAMLHNALGEIAYLRDNLAQAQAHATAALSLAELGRVRDAVLVGHELWVKIDLACGEATSAARRAATLLEHTAAANIPQLVAWAHAVVAWVALAQGRVAEAAAWAAGYRPGAGPLSPIRADEFVTYLRVLLATGRAAEARALVERQLPHTLVGGYVEQRLQLLALGAVACAAAGEPATAQQWLAEGLAIAAPQGVRRPFLSAGAPMRALLHDATASASLDDALRAFARSLAGSPPPAAQPATPVAPPAPGLAEPLTQREGEILRLTASGLSNQEIADLLVIGVGTVKTHLHSLYGKLDVRDRMGAVVRARALGLLD